MTAIVIQITVTEDIRTVSISNQVWMEKGFKGTPFLTAELFATDLGEEEPLFSVVLTGDPN